MRILQLIDSLAVGGAERMAVNLANLFSKEEIPNILISSREKGPLAEFVHDKKSIYCLGKKSAFDFSAFRMLLKIGKEFKPTHLHVHDSSIFWAVLLKKFLPATELIWHAHYGGFFTSESRFGNKIKFIASSIDYVIAVNYDLKLWVEKEFPKIKSTAFIQNFPDIPEQINRDKPQAEILCLANLKPPKNHHLLVRAFADFLKKSPGYKLKLVGSTDDKSYLESLNKEIENLGILPHVEIAGQSLNLSESFEKAEFAVLASDIEGLPVSLLELGLAKVPIVSTEVGQCSELLGHGEFGFLTPPGDEIKLSEMLTFVAEHNSFAKMKANAFHSHVSEKYGSKNFIDKYNLLLSQAY